jgi:carboxymethylenebutenolidase
MDMNSSMTAEMISLTARDGHVLSACEARPALHPRGGLVVAQEIFGVTGHIRRVCDRYAAQGYHVVAPAFFDRIGRGIELEYSTEDAKTGRELRSRIGWEQVFADVLAGRERVAHAGKIAVLGYCWGGTIAWRSATQLENFAAAVCYYATLIGPYVQEKPRCPVLMHFGERDPLATLEQVGQLRAAHGAEVEIEVYPAGHGFNCDDIPAYHEASAAAALRRTLAFLAAHVG